MNVSVALFDHDPLELGGEHHVELERVVNARLALFDDAQKAGVAVDFDGRSFVLLSQKNFDTVLQATNSSPDMIKHITVPRVDKPVTYILSREAFDDLVEIHKTLVSLIEADVRTRRPH